MEIGATHIKDIYVKSVNDKTDCCISGSTVLPGGKLIICDNYNNKILAIDTQKSEICELKVASGPWDLASIDKRHVAATLPEVEKVLLLTADPKLAVDSVIAVSGKCRGIACRKDRLFVTFEFPSKIVIMNLDGAVLRNMETVNVQPHQSSWLLYVDVSLDGQTIYVSDYNNCTITALSLDGNEKYVNRNSELKWPAKINVNITGSIFVCSSKANSIHIITPECVTVKPLLSRRNGLERPMAISFDGETNRLYIGMFDNNVKVYQL